MAALEEATSSQVKKPETCPNSNYKDKYSHLIGTSAAKDAAHTLEANRTYGCGECRWTSGCLTLLLVSLSPHAGLTCISILLPVPVANKRDTRSIEEAMNEIRAKKRQKQEDDTVAHSSSSWFCTSFLCVRVFVGAHASKYCLIHPEMQYMYFTKGLVLMTVVNTYMLTISLLMYWWSGSYVCLNWKTGTLSLIFCHF